MRNDVLFYYAVEFCKKRGAEVRVPVRSTYTYDYLYQGNFYPTAPQYNIVESDDDSSGNNQFGLTVTLRSDITL